MEQAIVEANKVLNKFGCENQEFEVKELKKNYVSGAEIVYYFTTNKNLNKGIHIAINAENGKCVGIWDNDLSNKNIISDPISKEDAEKIALEQDKKITDNEVDFVVTNLQIRQVNSWIYLLEQSGGKYPEFKQEELEDGTIVTYPQYRTVENRARKVWTVNIHYKKGEPDPNNEKKYNTKSIFVDVTTGEVVGGEQMSLIGKKKIRCNV